MYFNFLSFLFGFWLCWMMTTEDNYIRIEEAVLKVSIGLFLLICAL